MVFVLHFRLLYYIEIERSTMTCVDVEASLVRTNVTAEFRKTYIVHVHVHVKRSSVFFFMFGFLDFFLLD